MTTPFSLIGMNAGLWPNYDWTSYGNQAGTLVQGPTDLTMKASDRLSTQQTASLTKTKDPKTSDGESERSSDDDEYIDVVNDQDSRLTTDHTNDSPNTASPATISRNSSPTSSNKTDVTHESPARTHSVTPEGNKKGRTNYSPHQINALEKMFFENAYPDSSIIETLSQDIGVPENKIKVWFQNKRARWRRRVNVNSSIQQQQVNQQQLAVAMPTQMSSASMYGYLPAFSPMAPQAMPYMFQGHQRFYPQSPMQSHFPLHPPLSLPIQSPMTKQEEQAAKSPVKDLKGSIKTQQAPAIAPPYYYPYSFYPYQGYY